MTSMGKEVGGVTGKSVKNSTNRSCGLKIVVAICNQ
jgi:hypothetical protein